MKRIGLALLCSACATMAPAPTPQKPAPTEAELLGLKIAALEQHRAAFEALRADALWKYWLNGEAAPPPWAGHEVLLEDAALADVRRARELRVVEDLDGLEELIVGERVRRTIVDVDYALTEVEENAHFTFEGREVLYRELGGLLTNEQVGPRRKALWDASLPAAKQLDAARAQRDEAQERALAALGLNREKFSALLRRTDLEAARAWADRFLTATDARWKSRLDALRATSRADLFRVQKAPANLDAAFMRGRIAERGTQLLASLGLYGLPRLTLDLTDTARKQPLPLTVAGVRMSYKPRGGWRDQQALLAELGRALALWHSADATRLTLETSAALFGSLGQNRAWLEEQGLSPALVANATEHGADVMLLALRRAAGGVIGTAEGVDRAYALPDDPARVRLEIASLYAGVDTLRAQSAAAALARHLEAEAGVKWWSSPKATDVLRAFWKAGVLPEPVRADGQSGESLVAALGGVTSK